MIVPYKFPNQQDLYFRNLRQLDMELKPYRIRSLKFAAKFLKRLK